MRSGDSSAFRTSPTRLWYPFGLALCIAAAIFVGIGTLEVLGYSRLSRVNVSRFQLVVVGLLSVWVLVICSYELHYARRHGLIWSSAAPVARRGHALMFWIQVAMRAGIAAAALVMFCAISDRFLRVG